MPYQQSITYPAGSSGAQTSVNLDHSISPFQASVACIVGAGATANYKLQMTYDNFDSPTVTDAGATWFDSQDIPAGTVGSKISVINNPVTRIRLNITSLSGGTLTMTAVQGLSKN
jgi:putative aminopeptidase FrvX